MSTHVTKIYKKFMHEKDFQKYFVRQLVEKNGFVERTDTAATTSIAARATQIRTKATTPSRTCGRMSSRGRR